MRVALQAGAWSTLLQDERSFDCERVAPPPVRYGAAPRALPRLDHPLVMPRAPTDDGAHAPPAAPFSAR